MGVHQSSPLFSGQGTREDLSSLPFISMGIISVPYYYSRQYRKYL